MKACALCAVWGLAACVPSHHKCRLPCSCADCAPGLYLNGTQEQPNSTCLACTAGSYCPGGDALAVNSPSQHCPPGLETKLPGAKSLAQCFTRAGYGRETVHWMNGTTSYIGVICPVGSFNVGGNTAGCQKCYAGLTTSGTGKSSSRECCEYLSTA